FYGIAMSSNRSGVERLVWFYFLGLKSVPRARNSDGVIESSILPVKNLDELEDDIIGKIGFEHSYKINGHKAVLTLQDAKVSDCGRCFMLLVNVSDTAGSTKVIRDNKDHSRRYFSLEKGKDQGFEYSSHVLIYREKDSKGKYTTLVEKTPILSTHYICLFLNKVIFSISKEKEEEYKVKQEFGVLDSDTGKVREIRYKPFFQLESKPDENFMDAIKTGTFSSISLVSRVEKTINGADSNVEIIETQREVKLSTKLNSTTASFFSSIKQYYSDSFDTVKVSYKSGGINSSASFDISNISADGLEKVVTQKVIIEGFVDTLKDAYDKISSDIVEKMLDVTLH
ncbi:hypothetical protein, partial [Shewanella sp. Isolate7]|uniref:hypothetical protein n=1 Tax=Shewanella sp. Isolate7 TaxID=2908528 RepID=UPI001EFE9B9B